jgi:hypothetical protein
MKERLDMHLINCTAEKGYLEAVLSRICSCLFTCSYRVVRIATRVNRVLFMIYVKCSLKYVDDEIILYSFIFNPLNPEEEGENSGDITETTALLHHFRILIVIESLNQCSLPWGFMKRIC